MVRGAIVVCCELALGCAPDTPPIEPTFDRSAESAGVAPAVAASSEGRQRPDVLLISLDTLRADALSCYGNTRPTSPNIDEFASKGVRFARCYSPAPHTAPSHVSLLSGLLPTAHGVSNTNADSPRLPSINEKWPLLAEELARAGYRTMFVANKGQLNRDMGLDRGIEQFDASTNTFMQVQAVVEQMLDDVAADEPLFAFVHTYEPHSPYLPPRHALGEQLHGRFTSAEYDGVLRARYDHFIERVHQGAALAHTFLAGAEEFEPADVEFLDGLYHEDVLWTDLQFERLLTLWGTQRDLSNTIVVLVSDHGEQLGERGKFGHNFGLDIELVHVPFIVVGPGIEVRVEDAVVSLAAVAAGILEQVGLTPPAHYERGVQFSSGAPTGTVAHLQDIGRRPLLGVIEGRWQYLRGVGANSGIGVRAHDLDSDPRGLADSELDPDVLARLSALVDDRDRADKELRKSLPPRFDSKLTREQSDMLRDLGYAGDEGAEPSAPTTDSGEDRR